MDAEQVIELVQGDITRLEVDAIVNAANPALRGGGGVDGAVHRAAGPRLLEALRRYPGTPPGTAVITPGFNLKARFVIHAVGPVYRDGQSGEAELLERTYEAAFARAREEGSIRTIAFPAISTGVYRFPKEEAARIALSVVRRHEADFDRIIACLFDEESLAIYRRELQRASTAT